MANVTNAKFLESLLNAGATWRVAVLGTGYTYSSAHEFFSDLTSVLDVVTLSGVDVTDGVFDANDVTIAVGVIAAQINSLWVYLWTGTGSTSRLFRFNDTGLNFGSTPSGQVIIQWPSVTGVKIFPLGGLP